MDRILEPEVMDDEQQAIAYAKADFSSSNQMFVDGLLDAYASRLGIVLDIGCGPGDIPIRLARAKSSVYVVAVDASEVMVRLANDAVEKADLLQAGPGCRGTHPGTCAAPRRIRRDHLEGPSPPSARSDGLLGGGEAPAGGPGTAVYVMDLFRPATQDDARAIVESVSANEPEVLKRDFYNSLLAAFTPDEVRDQLRQAGLGLRGRGRQRKTHANEGC